MSWRIWLLGLHGGQKRQERYSDIRWVSGQEVGSNYLCEKPWVSGWACGQMDAAGEMSQEQGVCHWHCPATGGFLEGFRCLCRGCTAESKFLSVVEAKRAPAREISFLGWRQRCRCSAKKRVWYDRTSKFPGEHSESEWRRSWSARRDSTVRISGLGRRWRG
jgi:hypothetical protein